MATTSNNSSITRISQPSRFLSKVHQGVCHLSSSIDKATGSWPIRVVTWSWSCLSITQRCHKQYPCSGFTKLQHSFCCWDRSFRFGNEGGVISGWSPITFINKQFCPKLLRSSTYVWELAAITTVVKRWRQYLLGHHFIILMNHHSLKELMTQVIQTPEQHLYLSQLLGYDYTIQYRTSKSNVVADVLSRSFDNLVGSLFLLSMPNFLFLT